MMRERLCRGQNLRRTLYKQKQTRPNRGAELTSSYHNCHWSQILIRLVMSTESRISRLPTIQFTFNFNKTSWLPVYCLDLTWAWHASQSDLPPLSSFALRFKLKTANLGTALVRTTNPFYENVRSLSTGVNQLWNVSWTRTALRIPALHENLS